MVGHQGKSVGMCPAGPGVALPPAERHMQELKSLLCFIPGFPSSPVNLNYTPNTRSTFTVTVDLNWDFPMDDEGVANTSYLIFVNMSEVMNSTTNMATITLPFGVHLVQVAAVNDCGLSDNISRNINITGIAY